MMRFVYSLALIGLVLGCGELQTSVSTISTTSINEAGDPVTIVMRTENIAVGAVGETVPETFNTEKLPTCDLQVDRLHCVNCARSACDLLLEMDGVEQVKADSKSKIVTVSYSTDDFNRDAALEVLLDNFGPNESEESEELETEEVASEEADSDESETPESRPEVTEAETVETTEEAGKE